jgi:hypothetical protein
MALLDTLLPKAQTDQKPNVARKLFNWGTDQPSAPQPYDPLSSVLSLQQNIPQNAPTIQPSVPAPSPDSRYPSGAGTVSDAGTDLYRRAKTIGDASGSMPKPVPTAPVSLGPAPSPPAVPNAPLQPVSLGRSSAAAPAIPAATPHSTHPNTVFLGPRSADPTLRASARSASASAWPQAFPVTGAAPEESTTMGDGYPATGAAPQGWTMMADGSLGMADAYDARGQSAQQQLSELFPWLQQDQSDQASLVTREPTRIPETPIQRAASAEYNRIVDKIAESIRGQRGTARSIQREYSPHLLAGSYQVGITDPELGQIMGDIAGGISTRGIKNLREYVESKIADTPTSKQFKDEFDDVAAEAQKGPNSQSAQPALRKLLDHLIKFAHEKTSV